MKHIHTRTHTGLEASLGQFLKFSGVVVLATQASCALALMVASFSANALLTLALRKSRRGFLTESAQRNHFHRDLTRRILHITITTHNTTSPRVHYAHGALLRLPLRHRGAPPVPGLAAQGLHRQLRLFRHGMCVLLSG